MCINVRSDNLVETEDNKHYLGNKQWDTWNIVIYWHVKKNEGKRLCKYQFVFQLVNLI